jgi:hypothetical protein
MFALPPFRPVQNLGEDQRRLDRVEHFAAVKNLKQRIAAAVVHIGGVLARAPLRRNPLREVGSGAGNTSDFDFGVRLLKYPGIDDRAVAANVNRELPFLLSRPHRALPLGWRRLFRVSRPNRVRSNDQETN